MTVAAAVLAAGHGTRFKSATPKVLHDVAGWPLVRHVYQTALEAGCEPIVVVTQAGVDLGAVLGSNARLVEQPADDHGTAAATASAATAIGAGATSVVVLFGDSPLIRPETVRAIAELLESSGAAVVVAFARVAEAGDFGRVDVDAAGDVRAIMEAGEAGSESSESAPINAGLMAFDAAWLWGALERVAPSPVNGERYLPVTVTLARADGRRVVGHEIRDLDEAIGCDDLTKLAAAESAMQARLRSLALAAGVRLVDPASVQIHRGVQIGAGATILPNTTIEGVSRIGQHVRVGPNARLIDVVTGVKCTIESARIEATELGDNVTVGPFANIRRGCRVGDDCEIGSHTELKAARLGRRVLVHHFSYLGDVEVGDDANIGAGTVTCNFDGATKHRTIIGARAFIGSGTMLVAPVTVADGGRTGAGSVVTRDVSAGELVYGVPARPPRTGSGA